MLAWNKFHLKTQVAIATIASLFIAIYIESYVIISLIKENFNQADRIQIDTIKRSIENAYNGYLVNEIDALSTVMSDSDVRDSIDYVDDQSMRETLLKRAPYLQINGDYSRIKIVARGMSVSIDLGTMTTTIPDFNDHAPATHFFCTSQPKQCFMATVLPITEKLDIVGHITGIIPLDNVLDRLSLSAGTRIYSELQTSERPLNGRNLNKVSLITNGPWSKALHLYTFIDESQSRKLETATMIRIIIIGSGLSLFLIIIIIVTIRKPLSQMKQTLHTLNKDHAEYRIEDLLANTPASKDVEEMYKLAEEHVNIQLRILEEREKTLEAKSIMRVEKERADRKARTLRDETVSFEEERKRIAQELHDELGQYLVSAKIDANSLIDLSSGNPKGQEIASRIVDSVQRMYSAVANLLDKLQPPDVEAVGISQSIINSIQRWGKINPHIKFIYTIDESIGETNNAIKKNVYRIIQELMTNTMKYSEATSVEVFITVDNDERKLVIEYNDDGIGFDMATSVLGKGLTGIKERIENLDGFVEIYSAPGEGFTLYAAIPI